MLRRVAKIKRSTPIALAFDGNSLGAGYGNPAIAPLAQAFTLLSASFSDLVQNNVSVSGQTTREMNGLDGGSAADVDAAFVPGRINFLFVWEVTNDVIRNSATAATAAANMQSYVQNRMAKNPWRIIILSTLPRQDSAGTTQAAIDATNATLLAADAIIRKNCRAWGARGFIDVRCEGSRFRLENFSTAFSRNDDLWLEPAIVAGATSGGRVHLKQAGHAIPAFLMKVAVLNHAAR